MHKARWAVCQVEELICHKRPWRHGHWRGRDDTSSIAYGSAPPARHYTSDGLQAKGDPVRSARGRAIGQKGLASALYVLEGRCDESRRLFCLSSRAPTSVVDPCWAPPTGAISATPAPPQCPQFFQSCHFLSCPRTLRNLRNYSRRKFFHVEAQPCGHCCIHINKVDMVSSFSVLVPHTLLLLAAPLRGIWNIPHTWSILKKHGRCNCKNLILFAR